MTMIRNLSLAGVMLIMVGRIMAEDRPCDSTTNGPCPFGCWREKDNTLCQPVGPGYYSQFLADGRSECPEGTYQNKDRARECQDCPVGTISNAGASSCTICPAGTSSLERSSSCFPCPPGSFSSIDSGSTCEPCNPLYYSGDGSNGVVYISDGDTPSDEKYCQDPSGGTIRPVSPSSPPTTRPKTSNPTLRASTLKPSTSPSPSTPKTSKPSPMVLLVPTLPPTMLRSQVPVPSPDIGQDPAYVQPSSTESPTLGNPKPTKLSQGQQRKSSMMKAIRRYLPILAVVTVLSIAAVILRKCKKRRQKNAISGSKSHETKGPPFHFEDRADDDEDKFNTTEDWNHVFLPVLEDNILELEWKPDSTDHTTDDSSTAFDGASVWSCYPVTQDSKSVVNATSLAASDTTKQPTMSDKKLSDGRSAKAIKIMKILKGEQEEEEFDNRSTSGEASIWSTPIFDETSWSGTPKKVTMDDAPSTACSF